MDARFVIEGDDAALTKEVLPDRDGRRLSRILARLCVHIKRFQELPHDMAISLFYLGYAKEGSSRQCLSCWARTPARATPS